MNARPPDMRIRQRAFCQGRGVCYIVVPIGVRTQEYIKIPRTKFWVLLLKPECEGEAVNQQPRLTQDFGGPRATFVEMSPPGSRPGPGVE